MRTRKAKKPARRTGRKIAAKRTSVRADARSAHPIPRQPAAAPATSKSAWAVSPGAVAFGVVCIMAGAVLIGARRPSQSTDIGMMDSQAQTGRIDEAAAAAQPAAPRTAVLPPAAAAGARKRAVSESVTGKPAVESATAGATASDSKSPESMGKAADAAPTAKASEPESATKATATESAKTTDHESAPSVTIVGCVASDDETFWLKNPSGSDVPASRSWKSGFLKKRTPPIELMDAAHALKLPGYVGQRVSVTGTLTNRTLRPRSLQRVATSCN